MLDTPPSAQTEYSSIWTEWLSTGNFEQLISYHLEERAPFLSLLARHASANSIGALRVLEVGCGSAIDSCWIAAEINGTKAYAIDIVQASARVAKEVSRAFCIDINVVVSDAARMSFPDQSFDLVFSHGTLEHFQTPAAIIEEQVRVLKKAGVLAICVPQKYSLYTIYKHLRMMLGAWKYGWETQYSLGDLKKLSRPFGLRLIDYDGYDYFLKILARQMRRSSSGQRRFPAAIVHAIVKAVDVIFHGLEQVCGKRLRAYLAVNVTAVFRKEAPGA